MLRPHTVPSASSILSTSTPRSASTALGIVLDTRPTLGINSALNTSTSNALGTGAVLGTTTALVLPKMAREASSQRME